MAFDFAGHYTEALLERTATGVRALASTQVVVRQSDGTTFATLYTDRTKGTEAPNPTTTDGAGNLELWADPGDYLGYPIGPVDDAEGDAFDIVVPIDPAEADVVPVSSVNGETGVVVLDLGDLDDVDTTGAADGDALTLSSGVWVPTPPTAVAPDVQTFTTVGADTWEKPDGPYTWATVRIISGGGGGGSGARKAASSTREGAGGGAGGGMSEFTFLLADLPPTVAITVGAGGTGGAARTSDSGDGSDGSDGGASSFGDYLIVAGGRKGSHGGQFAGGGQSGGTNGEMGMFQGHNGALGGGGGTPPTSASDVGTNNTTNTSARAAGGGGGGAGVTSGNSPSDGGAGGRTALTGGTANTAGGTAGGPGAPGANGTSFGPGAGGGGGSSVAGGAGGNGGQGGLYGGGGGGGAASTNGSNSGRGGDGGQGAVRVVCW